VISIRHERESDAAAIFAVTEAAFADHPHSEGTEPYIVDKLREDGHLLLSLVAEDDGAEDDGQVVGHVAFSAAFLSDGSEDWMTLGPISVAPDRHGEGIGRAMIEESARLLREQGKKGIVLLGDPALYGRFGFKQHTPMELEGPLAKYLQVLSFGADIPAAKVTFAPAFSLVRVKKDSPF